MKRIGLLGGTFDPPHNGHLTIAKEAVQSLDLDEVWFIPTYEPPHKTVAYTNSIHRLRMLELMIEDEEKFCVETIEIDRQGTSYTIDTIKSLTSMYPNYAFYFIIGADQVKTLHEWHGIDELINMIEFVGVERPGVTWEETIKVTKLSVRQIDLASTTIRECIKDGKSVETFIKPAVFSYIKEHELYGYRTHASTR